MSPLLTAVRTAQCDSLTASIVLCNADGTQNSIQDIDLMSCIWREMICSGATVGQRKPPLPLMNKNSCIFTRLLRSE